MKKNYLLAVVVMAFAVLSTTACKEKKEKPTEEEPTTEEETSVPYTLSFEEVNSDYAPALQSFAWANVGHKLLIVGGRTNGFHGFTGASSVFTPKRNNTYFYVVDLDSVKTDSLPIPKKYYYQLRSTNMESYNDNGTLYCIGGYGTNSEVDSPPAATYETYARLTAINIADAMNAIENQDADALEASISMSEADDRLRVTGGELKKINDYFYLVFGQNFNTIYQGSTTGIYTQEVRKFKIDNSTGTPAITDYSADTCDWDDSSFHRRDLVVLENIMPNGKKGITVYGGVFTPVANGAYFTPIYIEDDNGSTKITTDNNFQQKFCQYAAPSITFHNYITGATYTSIIGGISQYSFDASGNEVNSNGAMPFINNVTTIVRKKDGSSVEYPQQSPTLPGLLGAEAIFIPRFDLDYTKEVSSTLLDFAKVKEKASDNTDKGFFIGYMYGGIESSAAQSSATQPTVASNKVFKVYIHF
ncbi:MAG: hypothetical protein ACN6I4_02155 [bacterium]